mmetsp:Transcript_89818/g.187744  ORF Transcript_89818/g.187744 Transcript_89818/m.187744 type:complete len:279 (+) Transcript_89818:107-943(+)
MLRRSLSSWMTVTNHLKTQRVTIRASKAIASLSWSSSSDCEATASQTYGSNVANWKIGSSIFAIENKMTCAEKKQKRMPVIKESVRGNMVKALSSHTKARVALRTVMGMSCSSAWNAFRTPPSEKALLRVATKQTKANTEKQQSQPTVTMCPTGKLCPTTGIATSFVANAFTLSGPRMAATKAQQIHTICSSVTPKGPHAVGNQWACLSCHCVMKKPVQMVASDTCDQRFGPGSSTIMATLCWPRQVMQSQPWSKSCPRGDEELVRRACFPSKASKVW